MFDNDGYLLEQAAMMYRDYVKVINSVVEIRCPNDAGIDKFDLIYFVTHQYPGKRRVFYGDILVNPSSALTIINYEFKGVFDFPEENINYELIFKNCTFDNIIICSDTVFKEKVQFHECHFKKGIIAENATFEKLIDFYMSRFYIEQQFHLTDFLATAIFSKVIFYGPVQFLYNKVQPNSFISFESADFRKSVDISRANFICRVRFWNASVSINYKNIPLYSNDEINKKEADDKITLNRLRESNRRIKEEFLKENNSISALQFHKNEMRLYWKEMMKKPFANRGDNFVLFMSWISNRHGTSWTNGIIFTLLVTFIGYEVILYTSNCNVCPGFNGNKIEWINGYFDLLNISKWNFIPCENKSISPYFSLWLYLSRIFIGFGIYQTISAFRKYSKK